MEQQLLDIFYLYAKKLKLSTESHIDSVDNMNLWLNETHKKLVELYPSGMTQEHYTFSTLCHMLLEESASLGYESQVDIMPLYSKCSGALLEDLFHKKLYTIIHTIITSNKIWGAAKDVFKNYETEYNEWIAAQ
jgi:hypothetical protein